MIGEMQSHGCIYTYKVQAKIDGLTTRMKREPHREGVVRLHGAAGNIWHSILNNAVPVNN